METVLLIREDPEPYHTTGRFQMDRQPKSELLLNLIGLALIVSIIVLLFFLMSVRSTKIQTSTEAPTSSPNYINITNFVLKIVPRDNWNATEPMHSHTNLTLPVHRIFVGHTGFNECRALDECTLEIQKLQIFYMVRKHNNDIGWNFMISDDGTIYEGCGWDNEGFHTSGYNADSIGIAFIGKFSRNYPSQEQFIALYVLIQEGIKMNKIVHDYKLYPQRTFLPLSDSPGKNVIRVIENWPHFKYN